MCGRTAETNVAAIRQEMMGLFGGRHRGAFQAGLLMDHPRYNIPPSKPLSVVGETGEGRFAESMKWGLVPPWARDAGIGNKLANARSETAAEKPSFRSAMKSRRCLIFVSGFFEWRAAKPSKQPFYIYRVDGAPMVFAGLWESWRQSDGSALRTCTILTREANALMATVHDRMPVIVERADYERWIDHAVTSAPLPPITAEGVLTMHAVSRAVNSTAHDDPDCVAPVAA